MLNYQIKHNKIYTSISGKELLSLAQLNKGTAFTERERDEFDLTGKLPYQVENIEHQVERAYQQLCSYNDPLNKNLFLNRLLNSNLVLFYKLLEIHTQELLPIVYTPIVGSAVQEFHHKFSEPRGLYISYPDRDKIAEMLDNRTHPEIDLILCTDGEGVLGIGDQGISGMAIAIAKLTVYSTFGKVNPMRTLPIMLDVGTNNQALLNDPMYPGWRSPRITGDEYDKFVDKFVSEVKKRFPKVMLHWEDFGRENAQRCLDRYQSKICSFNDDIQGTGVVALAATLSAIKKSGLKLSEQKIIIFGAGTAGMGVTQQIFEYLCEHGISEDDAKKMFWLVDRDGLLTNKSNHVTTSQSKFLRDASELGEINHSHTAGQQLFSLVKQVEPTILIGCSAQTGMFDKNIVTQMHATCAKPIILPLSNPTDKAEAKPADLYRWTDGAVITATGSPFPDLKVGDKTVSFSQCNNYLAFPGIGMGAIAIGASQISKTMLHAASAALADAKHSDENSILPNISEAAGISKDIAIAVAQTARAEGFGTIDGDIPTLINNIAWKPEYLEYFKS
jgi:malate dehydrogenase (oxaloacetate-decarboxylating)